MSIHYNEQTKVFHLQTDHTSYIFQILPTGVAGQVYYGPQIPVKAEYQNLMTREEHDCTNTYTDEQTDLQYELLKQEYASYGSGDYRYPAVSVTNPTGDRISEFKFTDAEIVDGKDRLAELPSTFDDDHHDAQTLHVHFVDAVNQLEMVLNYTVFATEDVIARSTTFINHGEPLKLNRALSLQLDLPDFNYDLIQFDGSWARERHLHRTPLRYGMQSNSSLRFTSGHHSNPFFMLARPETNELAGSAYGFNLIYSGNFIDSVEVDQFDVARVLTGINPAEFSWELTSDATFQTPEAIMTYTDAGLNALSQNLADFYNHHLLPSRFVKQERPTLVNNWEATFMDFTEDKLMPIVNKAHDLGIEMFVLDDGSFGHRDNDQSSLGDWFVDHKKFINGVGGFAHRVHQLGMKFGLWFEPEMVSEDSELFKAHPEWRIGAPHRHHTPARHQFVLDYSNPAVVDFIYDEMAKVITDTKLDYIKWDMNRSITEAFSTNLPADRQTEFGHRYILGVYRLYDRLTTAFPDVLFESCASGGGRFDLGMMYYAPQAWASDNTDAVERLSVQTGSSYGYSQNMWGAHVSAVPNDQNGRLTSLDFRAKVAYFGAFGYELDLNELSNAEQAQVKDQVAFYKQYRSLFQFGKFYRLPQRLQNPANVTAWAVVNDDQTQAIATYFQVLNPANPAYVRFYLAGLDPQKHYRVNDGDEIFSGQELMTAGYFLPRIMPRVAHKDPADFKATMLIIKAVD